MITATATRSVSTMGEAIEASYTIQDSAKIFSILRSNIYSDKMLAVVREYSTNGWDGHILAGTPDRPLKITLPTLLAPVFKVRDFGVGMSEETVLNVYTSYGTSTKDSSNDFNGTFGLGSKSAFAYGNSFDIISFFNGTKTMYTAYLDESNIGKIRRVYSEPTTEHNGIEINVTIRTVDVSKFRETACNFYKYFTPTPVFINSDDSFDSAVNSVNELKVITSGNGWKAIEGQAGYYGNRSTHMVIMGNVAYPLNIGVLPTDRSAFSILTEGRYSNNLFIVEAPIGELSITASRESLEYDKRTINWLDSKFNSICDELAKNLQSLVDSQDNSVWNVAKIYNNFNFSKAVMNRVKLPAHISSYLYGDKISLNGGNINAIKTKYNASFNEYSYFNTARLKSYKTTNIYPNDRIVLCVNVKGAVKEKDINAHIRGVQNAFRSSVKDATVIRIDVPAVNNADDLRNSDIFKGATIVNIQDYPAVRYSTNRGNVMSDKGKERAKAKVFEFLGTDYTAKQDNWDVSDVDIANGNGVYVLINKYESTGEKSINAINRAITSICELTGEDKPTIYGIRESAKGIGSGWVSAEQWILDTTKDYIKKNKLGESVQKHFNVQNQWGVFTRLQLSIINSITNPASNTKYNYETGKYEYSFCLMGVIMNSDNDTLLKGLIESIKAEYSDSTLKKELVLAIDFLGRETLGYEIKDIDKSLINTVIDNYPCIHRINEIYFFEPEYSEAIRLVKGLEASI